MTNYEIMFIVKATNETINKTSSNWWLPAYNASFITLYLVILVYIVYAASTKARAKLITLDFKFSNIFFKLTLFRLLLFIFA